MVMRRSTRSPIDESQVVGRIVIENLPRRALTTSDIHTWLKKYGAIYEIVLYKTSAIVQFGSDLEAAGAVQCEDGGQYYGSIVAVKHAEPGLLSAVRRSGPPVDQFPAGNRRYSDKGNSRDREREREADRARDRNRPRERESSPRSRHSEDPYDRRRRRDDQSPRRRSRSPVTQRGDRRHVHPLNWLSEVAGTDKKSAVNGSTTDSGRPTTPYTVAIVATQHDLVAYAELIEKRISASLKVPDYMDRASVRTHIIVLIKAEDLTPCLADLTKDGVPFAIVCTTTNFTHGSCTLRILYGPTQQEHRNMPLDDAMILLQKEYDTKLALERPAPAPPVPKPVAPPADVPRSNTPVVPPDDRTFLAPTRDMSNLLRMLADSRILSIGELDEIAAFVQERKRRLEGRRQDAPSADTAGAGNAVDLKSRILNMIYPQTSGATPDSYGSSSGTFQPLMNTTMPPPQPNPPTNKFNLTNSAVQQAFDTLLNMPKDRFMQPQTAPGMNSFGGSRQDMMMMSAHQPPKVGSTTLQTYDHTAKGSFLSYRNDSGTTSQSAPNQTMEMTQRFASSYSKPMSSMNDSNQPSIGSQTLTSFTASRGTYNTQQTDTDEANRLSQANSGTNAWKDDSQQKSRWRNRKRGRRLNLSEPQQQHSIPSLGTSQKYPVDLMSVDVKPVGSLADSFKQESHKYPQKVQPLLSGPAGGPGLLSQPTAAPYYLQHPSGIYPYSGQSYY